MKRIILILTLFLIIINMLTVNALTKVNEQDIKITASDGFSLTAKLEYPKLKGKKEYSTVVLLHSLGYSSAWWESLPNELLDRGYAVLLVDFRGHGTSVYNSKLTRTSWKNMKNSAFKKYPDDVISVIDHINKENKRKYFNNWILVGSDIGSVTAVLVANKINNKPKAIVMISPVVSAKGLYAPVKLAELDNTDFLSITGINDSNGKESENYLKKFAQTNFATYVSESKSTGMIMLKNDKSLSKVIASWINEYLK